MSTKESSSQTTLWDPPAFVWVLALSVLEVLILFILFAVETPLTPVMNSLTHRPMWLVLFVSMLTIGLGFFLACIYQIITKLQTRGASR